MRWDRDFKLVRMIRLSKTTSGAALSANAYGSTGSTAGVVDTTGWDRCRLELSFQARTNTTTQAVKTLKIGFQSAVSTLYASATVFSGLASGIVLSAKTSKCAIYAVDFALHNNGSRKRFMNCKYVYSGGTSGSVELRAYLYRGEQFPPSTTGFTALSTLS